MKRAVTTGPALLVPAELLPALSRLLELGHAEFRRDAVDLPAEVDELIRLVSAGASAYIAGRKSAPATEQAVSGDFRQTNDPAGNGRKLVPVSELSGRAENLGERRLRQLLCAAALAGERDRAGRWLVDVDDFERFLRERKKVS
jgi:hypothetical protein